MTDAREYNLYVVQYTVYAFFIYTFSCFLSCRRLCAWKTTALISLCIHSAFSIAGFVTGAREYNLYTDSAHIHQVTSQTLFSFSQTLDLCNCCIIFLDPKDATFDTQILQTHGEGSPKEDKKPCFDCLIDLYYICRVWATLNCFNLSPLKAKSYGRQVISS